MLRVAQHASGKVGGRTRKDVDAIVANEPAAEWNEKDCCLRYFLGYAEKAGLRVTPLAFEPGFCRQRNDGVVEMTTDLSVFEVQAVTEE